MGTEDEESARRSHHRKLAALAVATHSVSTVPMILLSTLAVAVRTDLGFGTSAQGLLISGEVALAVAVTVLAGRIIDRSRSLWLMSFAAFTVAVSLTGTGLARSLPSLIPFFALGALAMGIAQPATDACLHRFVPQRIQGITFSIKQAAAGPGTGLAAGLAVPVTEALWGWRSAFWIAAGVAVLIGLAVARQARAPVALSREGGEVRAHAHHVLPRRQLMWLAVAGGLCTAPQSAYLTFAVSGAVHDGLSRSTAGLLFAGSCALCIANRIYLGRRVDTHQGSLLGWVALLVAGSSGGFLLFSTAWQAGVLAAMPLLAVTAWGWHGLFFLVAVRTSPGSPGRASGFAGGGVLIGAVVGPVLFGFAAESSYRLAWVLAGLWSLVGAWSVLAARRSIVATLGWTAPAGLQRQ